MVKTSPPRQASQGPTRFDARIPYILKEEMVDYANWNDPRNLSHDPGATMCGIEQGEWWEFCTYNHLPRTPVQDITKQQALIIYRQNYWSPHCDSLPIGLDLQFFDSCVNQGGAEAIRILQVALKIHNDGYWGPQTSSAVAQISKDLETVIAAFATRRLEVYLESPYHGDIADSPKVHADWNDRTKRIANAAMQIAGFSRLYPEVPPK